MAQHDYVIANGSGSAVRSDLNNALAAIVSHNSGTSEPTTTYAYMPWADTSAGVMKLRNGANNAWITLYQLDGEYTTIPLENGTAAAPSLYFKTSGTDTGLYSPGTDQVAISTAGTGRLFVDSDGKVGIGTTAPQNPLVVSNGGANGFEISSATNSGTTSYLLSYNRSTSAYTDLRFDASAFRFEVGASEKARIDSSGRLLVGTSSARTYTTGGATGNHKLQIETAGGTNVFTTAGIYSNSDVPYLGAYLELGRSKGTSLGAVTAVAQDDILGEIRFAGTNGTGANSAASIAGYVDGAVSGGGANDMPGRLVFSTTADGTSSPTERFRIDSSGRLLLGTSTSVLEKLVIKADGGGIQINRNDSGGSNPTSGQALGSIGFKGIVSANSNAAAEVIIQAAADEAHSGSSAGSRLEFHTKPSGTGPGSSPTERLRISNNGQLSAVIPGNSTLYPGFMARAWVNFDGTGTVAIRASGNVSSITDNGAGDYTVNFTTAMADTNYAVCTDCQLQLSVANFSESSQSFSYATGSVRVACGYYLEAGSNNYRDQAYVHVAIFR